MEKRSKVKVTERHFIIRNFVWILAVCVLLYLMLHKVQAHAADTAVKQDPLNENQFRAMEIVKGWHMNPKDVGVYYIPPRDTKSGFVFDDIPRDAISPNHKQLTAERMKKQYNFVKFNARHISFSVMETRDESLRLNYFPNKGAVMLNWTYIVEPGKWWWFE